MTSCSFDWFTSYVTYNPRGDVSCTISRSKGQGHTGHSKFLLCLLCGFLPIWPNGLICGTSVTNEMTMHHAQFADLKDQRLMSHGAFQVFTISASWLSTYVTNSLNMGHKCNPWGNNALHTISRSKGESQNHMGRSYLKYWPLVVA